MSGMTTTNLQDNEIVKASDLQLGGESGIDNLSFVFRTMTNCENNVILGGKLRANTTGSGLIVKMDPIIGYHQDSDKMFLDHKGQVYMDGETEPADYVSFMAAESQDRRDTVEVKADVITAVEQSRQFYDPDTESTSYSQVDIEKRQVLRVKVKKGEPGTNVAPETDTGYIKIAEVLIPANASQLSDENIFNVTADIDGMDNSGWTVEKTATVNPGTLQTITDRFRKIHKSDGSLKESVIKAANIILNGAEALKGSGIQKGGAALTIDGETVAQTASIEEFIDKIVARLNKTWEVKNGGTGGENTAQAHVNLFGGDENLGSSNMSDKDFLITGYADNTGELSETKHLYRRPLSTLKNWLKSQTCASAASASTAGTANYAKELSNGGSGIGTIYFASGTLSFSSSSTTSVTISGVTFSCRAGSSSQSYTITPNAACVYSVTLGSTPSAGVTYAWSANQSNTVSSGGYSNCTIRVLCKLR